MDQEKETKEQEEKESSEEEFEEPDWSQLPPVTFENFIFGLYNTALMHFGIRDPETGKLIQNLPLAKHTIDTIGMLEEKTKGNLTVPEANLLENLLYELRMSYLRAVKQAETKPQEESEAEKSEEDKKEQ